MKTSPIIVAVMLATVAGCTRRGPDPQQSALPSVLPTATATATPSVSVSPTVSVPAPVPTPPFPVRLKGQDITRIATTKRVAALTFDAGANMDGLASIVATLRREGVPVTFFLTGDFVQRYPSAAKSLKDFRIGNHTMTHPHLPALSDAQVRAQVTDAQGQIRSVVGKDPRPLLRFPYGDRDGRTIQLANSLGYLPVRWTVDSLGWQGTERHTAAAVANRELSALQPGMIVLMHTGSNPDDHSTLDADALPAIIDGLRSKGYGFVTLDMLLE
jgi:peptidoglycan/xylan/chitin deacetylase (PgdA/CDA1 family)